jgi:hypothetical protein
MSCGLSWDSPAVRAPAGAMLLKMRARINRGRAAFRQSKLALALGLRGGPAARMARAPSGPPEAPNAASQNRMASGAIGPGGRVLGIENTGREQRTAVMDAVGAMQPTDGPSAHPRVVPAKGRGTMSRGSRLFGRNDSWMDGRRHCKQQSITANNK